MQSTLSTSTGLQNDDDRVTGQYTDIQMRC